MNARQRARLLKTLMGPLSAVVPVHPDLRFHTKKHWRRVAEVAGELAALAAEPNDLIRAPMVAGLLHDIGRVSDCGRRDPHHGKRSVEIAKKKKLLELLGVDSSLHRDVYDAIARHTHGVRTNQRVAKYLWDADRLCLVGFYKGMVDPQRMITRVWPQLCRR